MDINEIERLHDAGLMPDWAYYQQNGKSPEENLREQHYKMMQKLNEKKRINREFEIYKARQRAEIEKEIDQQIEEEIMPKIEKVIDDLFADWQ